MAPLQLPVAGLRSAAIIDKADARRQVTRVRRIDRILPMIADGKGLNDKYRGR